MNTLFATSRNITNFSAKSLDTPAGAVDAFSVSVPGTISSADLYVAELTRPSEVAFADAADALAVVTTVVVTHHAAAVNGREPRLTVARVVHTVAVA